MPEIPYTGDLAVNPNLPATPGVHPNVGADAFGASIAQATTARGAALERAGNELFGRAYQMQQMDQQADVINAHADVVDKTSELHMKFQTLEGAAAKNGFEDYKAGIAKIIDEGGKGLSSDYARQLYGNETRVLRSRLFESGATHAASEFKKYQIGTDEARGDLAVNQVSMFPDDERVYKSAVDTMKSVAASMQGHHGWSQEQADDYFTKKVSKAVAYRVKSLADRGQITEAESVVNDAISNRQIDGPTASGANELIRHKRNQITTRVDVPEFLGGAYSSFGRGKVSDERLWDAIVGAENSGRNPRLRTEITAGSHKGEFALGLGQVLQSNLQPWLEMARKGGVSIPDKVSEEDFLNDAALQKRLCIFILHKHQEDSGSANGAAKLWRGLAKVDPTNGGTEEGYIRNVNQRLAKSASREELGRVSDEHAEELAPGDINFREHYNDASYRERTAMVTAEKQQFAQDSAKVGQALLPDPKTGKGPTKIEDVADPEIHEIWDRNAAIRAKYQHVLDKNAEMGGYRVTDENRAAFLSAYDTMTNKTNPAITDEMRNAMLDEDFRAKPWPLEYINRAVKAQESLRKGYTANPPMEWAMKQFDGQIGNMKVKPSDQEFKEIKGEMRILMEDYIGEKGHPPSPEEIRSMGAGLVSTAFPHWYGDEKFYSLAVPKDQKAAFRKVWKDKYGVDPSDQDIQHAYAVAVYLGNKRKSEKK